MKSFKLKISIFLFTASVLSSVCSSQITQVENLKTVECIGLTAVDLDETAIINGSAMPGIHDLLYKSINSIGVTARPISNHHDTRRELFAHNIKFKSQFLKDKKFVVFDSPDIFEVFYSAVEGVLYCGKCPKGPALAMLHKLDDKKFPTELTVCDDRIKNIISLKNSFLGKGTNRFTGYHVRHPDVVRLNTLKFIKNSKKTH